MVNDNTERVLSLIEFLGAFDAQKNPPVHDIAAYGLFRLEEGALPQVPGVQLTPTEASWLSVDFLELPPRPAIPKELTPVVGDPAGSNATRPPSILTPDNPTDAELRLIDASQNWIDNIWQPWSVDYNKARAAKDLYRDLFELRTRLASDRDALELVWGFGRLRYRASSGEQFDHPLLAVEVEIEINDESRQITVKPAGAVEVESLFLADVDLANRSSFSAIRQQVADEAVEVWDSEHVVDLIRKLVRSIDHNGGVRGEVAEEHGVALATNSWSLFLRRRQADYQSFLDDLREIYQGGAIPPATLQAVVVDSPSALVSDGSQGHDVAEPLLLPLASNEEQQRILRSAKNRPGVTVQGPPGTGKSHTIANIISHHVAYGRRVLVVAEKEQALRVLADKVPPGIRDLTVSVLGSDAEGRRRLESSIRQIQSKVTAIDQTYSAQQVKLLQQALEKVDQSLAATTKELLSVRAAEVSQLPGDWAAGSDPTPAVAARWLAQNSVQLDYIPDRLEAADPMPLSSGEFAEYVDLLSAIGLVQAIACARKLPNTSELPTSDEVAEHLSKLRSTSHAVAQIEPHLSGWSKLDAASPQQLAQLGESISYELSWQTSTSRGFIQRFREQASDPALLQGWQDFIAECQRERQHLLQLGGSLDAHRIEVPQSPDHEFVRTLSEAGSRIRQRGKLGMFASAYKQVLEVCRVDGRVPASADSIDLCLKKITLDQSRSRLRTLWDNRVARIDGPQLDSPAPEDPIGHHLEQLAVAIGEHARLAKLQADLESIGVAPQVSLNPAGLEWLTQLLPFLSQRRPYLEEQKLHDKAIQRLDQGAQDPVASPLWFQLLEALKQKDISLWEEALVETNALSAITPQAARLRDLHQKLHGAAPLWANKIASDPRAAQNPNNFEAAWEWQQLRTWVETVEESGDATELQRQLEKLGIDRRRAVTDLVSEMAWLRLASNVGDKERQALNSYLQAVKRYGKTGGKFASRWLAQIRTALNDSKDAVPVWIMPTRRALTSFRPDATPRFDVLIIDESSQLGLDALPLFSLAKSTIVVGDDKQTSPDNVGLDRQLVYELLDQYLKNIPKYRTLFDPDSSLYDLAFQKFPDVVMLTEHFRSLPPIIEFSNQYAYNNAIVPLRDQLPQPGWPTLGSVKVQRGIRDGDVNEPEAIAVVDLIAELCEDPDYDGMTFGVISLLGTAQSKRIWDLIYDRMGPDVIRERQVRCGEAAAFQGDERDVIIISTVVANDPNNPSGRIGAMTGVAGARRINVAASRARDQMWVVHSVEPDRFPLGDLRAELIRHCRNSGLLNPGAAPNEDHCESEFERAVLRAILERGYRMIEVQYPVGRFRIDIVVAGPDSRLAIECDGDTWHGEEEWRRERAREAVLERAGWTFERIRGSSFFLDPSAALEPLWKRLAELGIPTGDEWINSQANSTVRVVDQTNETAQQEIEPAIEATAIPAAEDRQDWTPSYPDLGATGKRAVGVEQGEIYEGFENTASVESNTPPELDPEVSPVPPVHDLDELDRRTAETDEGADPVAKRNDLSLGSYREWEPSPLPDLALASQQETIDGLVRIIAAEGPVLANRAYRIYAKSSGGVRVGPEMRRLLNRAVLAGVRSGAISQLSDLQDTQTEKTLYLPGSEPVVLRERGPRELYEIPRSELQLLLKTLGPHLSFEELKRATLEALNLIRMTSRASDYLDECLHYTWGPSVGPADPPQVGSTSAD